MSNKTAPGLRPETVSSQFGERPRVAQTLPKRGRFDPADQPQVQLVVSTVSCHSKQDEPLRCTTSSQ